MTTKWCIVVLILGVTLTSGVAQLQGAEQVAGDDAAIRAKVEGAFERNPAVADSGIRVASVTNGVVLLHGIAMSLEAHLLAVDLAAEIQGVQGVTTEVVVVERPSIPTSPMDSSGDVGLTGCIREVGSRYVLTELTATGHALPEHLRPRKLILKSGETHRVRLDKHVANIVAVTGRVEATPTFIGTPTLVVSSLRIVSDTCQA